MDTKLKMSKGIISTVASCLATIVFLIGVQGTLSLLRYNMEFRYMFDGIKTNYKDTNKFSDFVGYVVGDSVRTTVQNDPNSFLDSYTKDENIYLEVRHNDIVTLRSTGAYVKTNGIDTVMPEGYNFMLHYKNGQAQIKQNGKLIDVYGPSKTFSENSRWRVSGYTNYVASDEAKNVEVFLAIKDPVQEYDGGTYDGYTYMGLSPQRESSLVSDLCNEINTYRQITIAIIAVAAIFIVLATVSFLFRKHKKLVHQKIAWLTGKIWFEFKVLCVLFVLYVLFAAYLIITHQMYSAIFSNLFLFPLIGLIFNIWLLANDIYYNKAIYKNSLFIKLWDFATLKNFKVPVSRKYIAPFIVAFFAIFASFSVFSLMLATVSYSANRMLLVVLVFVPAMFLLFAFMVKMVSPLAMDMEKLVNYLDNVYNGKHVAPPHLSAKSPLENAIKQIDCLEEGLEKSVAEKMKSEHMKIELIANVSHDIKTPLTSVISYIDLLKDEKDLPTHVCEYITILDEKAERLKNMVQDVFEVSKAASGQLPVNLQPLDLSRLLRQTLADMEDATSQSGLIIVTNLPTTEIMINADGERMYRVYQNIIENALKYSLVGSRIYVGLSVENGVVTACVKNVSAQPLSSNVDFTERFVRADESRTDGSSGLGLSISQSFTSACGGRLWIETNADLFLVYTSFNCIE